MWYKLDANKNPIPATDLNDYHTWITQEHNGFLRVGEAVGDKYRVSTVFLGLDHNHRMDVGAPILFETMVFSEDSEEEKCVRYATWKEAVRGHAVYRQMYRADEIYQQDTKEILDGKKYVHKWLKNEKRTGKNTGRKLS